MHLDVSGRKRSFFMTGIQFLRLNQGEFVRFFNMNEEVPYGHQIPLGCGTFGTDDRTADSEGNSQAAHGTGALRPVPREPADRAHGTKAAGAEGVDHRKTGKRLLHHGPLGQAPGKCHRHPDLKRPGVHLPGRDHRYPRHPLPRQALPTGFSPRTTAFPGNGKSCCPF